MDAINALKASHLYVRYGSTAALVDVSFSIPAGGKVIAIIGPNGAGKSTLLQSLLGFIKPAAGKMAFWGKPYAKVRKKVAYIPQRSSIDWDFPITVFDVVCMGLYAEKGLFARVKKEDKERAYEVLKTVGLEGKEHRQIGELSGGQQQRVFLARALIQRADMYFMDEPFAGVDLATEKSMVKILHQLAAEGKTIFVVHHDLHTVSAYFDWVLLLHTRLIGCGPVAEVFHFEGIRAAYGEHFALLMQGVFW